MRPEKKWVDVPGTLAPPIGSAFVVTPLHLNPTSGGVGASNARIGSKINMTSLDVKFNIIWPGNQAVASPSQVRTVIVYDKQANAAAPQEEMYSQTERCGIHQEISSIKIDSSS